MAWKTGAARLCLPEIARGKAQKIRGLCSHSIMIYHKKSSSDRNLQLRVKNEWTFWNRKTSVWPGETTNCWGLACQPCTDKWCQATSYWRYILQGEGVNCDRDEGDRRAVCLQPVTTMSAEPQKPLLRGSIATWKVFVIRKVYVNIPRYCWPKDTRYIKENNKA